MVAWLKSLTENYYAFWTNFANLKEKAHILPLNFLEPWTRLISRQKVYLIIALSCEIVIQTFYTIYPFLIGIILEKQTYSYFLYLIGTWLCIIFLEYISMYFSLLLETQCINSVQYNAFEFFLTADPIFHTMKASGKLFAKIERCARAYEDFLDIILWDILPVIIGMTTVIVTFLITDLKLGIVALILLTIIALINISLNLFTNATFEHRIIDADDTVKALSVESLTQVPLIRSSFATNEIAELARVRNRQMMHKQGTAWLAFAASVAISRFAYLISILVLGSLIFSLISSSYLSVLAGTTLLLTYINGTYEIIQIGRRLRKLLQATTRINDLFNFIRKFGKQTFPVLSQEHDIPIKRDTQILLEAKDLHFDYNPKAKIFENHSLVLRIDETQPSKLYGIIGPSGMGKTTLLSILGGQLKPDRGNVLLNHIPIYEIDDRTRRHLIAIQGQQATNLSGTVRSNLLLGLPYNGNLYSNDHIISILKAVGIWKIFEEKEGLETPIGEGGLSLSGGQRQRLNFAGLYLRAHYYKPLLILIDEPTSSLDEVSERAITSMISELAQNAITIVIAHRLNTLNDATAILDFSLLDTDKDIQFYTRQELEEHSSYYRRLISGDITMDA